METPSRNEASTAENGPPRAMRTVTTLVPLLAALLFAQVAGAVTFLVNSTDDDFDNNLGDGLCWTGGWVFSGRFGVRECTLRAAIQEANHQAGADTISFASSQLTPNIYGRVIFAPGTAYPVITSPLTIDGTTFPNYDVGDPNAAPLIVLDGSFLGGASIPGLTLAETADGSVVRGLTIIDFPYHGISVGGADSVLIEGNHIGLNRGVVPEGNGGSGIYVYSFSAFPTIGQSLNPLTGFEGRPNVISGNAGSGITITGNGATVLGNRIGTDATGNAISTVHGGTGNGGSGIHLLGTASNATIGDAYELPLTDVWVTSGNVIAGNQLGGILTQSTGSGIEIYANHVGLGLDGSTPLGNYLGNGIDVRTDGTIVGADDPHRNVVSGNAGKGIAIGISTTIDPNGYVQNAEVIGNYVGVDATASFAIANFGTGIGFAEGDNAEIAYNVVGGNLNGGISVFGNYSSVYGNFVGTNAGRADLGNDGRGVYVNATVTEIGRAFDPNVIGFNDLGIELVGSVPEATIRANWIGADPSGNAFGNEGHGILLRGNNNFVGGNTAAHANIVGNNGDDGIHVDASCWSNEIQGNYIGTNASGADLGNDDDGVEIAGADETTVGEYVGTGTALDPAKGNHIAFNGDIGVHVSSGHDNAVRGNAFGSNGGLPVDLGAPGAELNDYLDEDSGANWRQNSPVIAAGHTSYDDLTGLVEARYLVDSWADSAYPLVIDFYVIGPDGLEPDAWIGSDMYLWTDATLDRDVSFAPAVALTGTEEIVAIATDADGNSSEVGDRVALPEPGLALGLFAGLTLLSASVRGRAANRKD